MERIKMYFEACVNYYLSRGDSKEVAVAKAFWWDCVEVWNIDKSWDPDRIAFVNQFVHYEPYTEIPSEEEIENGHL